VAHSFTRAADRWLGRFAVGAALVGALAVTGLYYYAVPTYTRVGYQPIQPVPFSHDQHVRQIGLDCRYCHSHVEESPHSTVPATQTCMNCHKQIKTASALLAPIRESWDSGEAVDWIRVHKVPGYVQFNHSVHVRRGVSCVSCHGRVDEMPVVYHHEPLSMGWCLSCHRNPEESLRPLEEVTNLAWTPTAGQSQSEIGAEIQEHLAIRPPLACSGCHR